MISCDKEVELMKIVKLVCEVGRNTHRLHTYIHERARAHARTHARTHAHTSLSLSNFVIEFVNNIFV